MIRTLHAHNLATNIYSVLKQCSSATYGRGLVGGLAASEINHSFAISPRQKHEEGGRSTSVALRPAVLFLILALATQQPSSSPNIGDLQNPIPGIATTP